MTTATERLLEKEVTFENIHEHPELVNVICKEQSRGQHVLDAYNIGKSEGILLGQQSERERTISAINKHFVCGKEFDGKNLNHSPLCRKCLVLKEVTQNAK